MKRVTAATALFAGLFLLVAPAEAGLTLCNKTRTGASVAIGYLDGAKGWTAQGWWSVAGGDCQALAEGKLAGSTIYLLVDGGRLPPGKKQSGGWFCTDDTGFITRNADYSNGQHELLCEAAGLKTEQFHEIKIGGNTFTLDLTK
jgi:uncharacterized membrane protein